MKRCECGHGYAMHTFPQHGIIPYCKVPDYPCTTMPEQPDRGGRDGVRDALILVLRSASLKSVDNLDDALGTRHTTKFADTADALLSLPEVVTDEMVEVAYQTLVLPTAGRITRLAVLDALHAALRTGRVGPR